MYRNPKFNVNCGNWCLVLTINNYSFPTFCRVLGMLSKGGNSFSWKRKVDMYGLTDEDDFEEVAKMVRKAVFNPNVSFSFSNL